MAAVLFQIVDGNETVSHQGFPSWVFWLMLAVILILVIFILIRDQRVRGQIKKFFSWFFNKIRVARLKSRINRITQQKTVLLAELGKTVWEKNIKVDGIDAEKREIDKLNQDETGIQREIQRLDGEIDKQRTEADDFDGAHQAKVAEVEKKKNPLDIRYRELNKSYDSLQDQIKNLEKLKVKLSRSIQQHRQEIEKIESDGYLSKIEKESKKKEQDKQINDIQKQGNQTDMDIISLKDKGESLYRERELLKKEISVFTESLDRFKTEKQAFHKKNDEAIEKLQKSRKALGIKKIGIQKQLSLAFEKVGEKINQSRIEHEDLKRVFVQIDQVEKQINELEKRLGKS
jgi:chromosome segregation ATPase